MPRVCILYVNKTNDDGDSVSNISLIPSVTEIFNLENDHDDRD